MKARKKAVHRPSIPASVVARITRVETKCDMLTSNVEKLTEEVDKLTAALHQYKGAWGLLVLLGTAVATFFMIFWDSLVKRFTGTN